MWSLRVDNEWMAGQIDRERERERDRWKLLSPHLNINRENLTTVRIAMSSD